MELGVSRGLSYQAARRLLVATGLVVLATTAVVLYVRRVEDIEVVAVLLFVPIYLAVVAGKMRGGIVAAVLASAAYAALRLHGVNVYDRREEIGLVASRTIAYCVFGLVGGFAVRQLEAAVAKLDRYDLIDDDTGLFNARFLASELELEMARSKRYGSSFSVVTIDGEVAPLVRLRRSQRGEALRSLGSLVSDGVRLVDRAGIAQDRDRFLVAVVMPETDAAGAGLVAKRLASGVASALPAGSPDASLRTTALTFPGDDDPVVALRQRFIDLDRAEHPTAVPGPGG